jgi:hypothetical protein
MDKCPRCNTPVKPGQKFCTKCGERLTEAQPAQPDKQEQAAPQTEQAHAPQQGAADVVQTSNHHIYWTIQQGQIARVITPQEMSAYTNAKGVIVSEGTTAYVRVNGKTVATLSGGVYEFKDGIAKTEGGNAIQKAWSFVTRLFEKKPKPEEEEQKALLLNLQKAAAFSIVVLVDKAFPVLVGAKQPTIDDYKTFQPMVIKTKYYDLKVGLNAMFQIQDKERFIAHYLTDCNLLTTAHIVDTISDSVRTSLQQLLEDREWDGSSLPAEIRREMKDKINEIAPETFYGLGIARIIEITADSADMERFRNLSREMYLSEQELDYLQRTNEFRNRMTAVQNAQQIAEARSEAELRAELDKINKDNLLKKDEMDKFQLMLDSQRRLREARTKEEEDALLAEIRKQGLLRDIDYRRLEQEADLERRQREADFEFREQQRQEQLKMERRQKEFEMFMSMENANNAHELEMARIHAETDKEWNERMREQQQRQNDQMMEILRTMAGNNHPQQNNNSNNNGNN